MRHRRSKYGDYWIAIADDNRKRDAVKHMLSSGRRVYSTRPKPGLAKVDLPLYDDKDDDGAR
jgi:hypothetical protein